MARRIFNPVFFCVNHLFSLVFFFLPGFCTVFKSGQTGNECINNIPSKGMKSVNQESRAADPSVDLSSKICLWGRYEKEY